VFLRRQQKESSLSELRKPLDFQNDFFSRLEDVLCLMSETERLIHGGIIVTSGVEEMPLPNLVRPSHGGITITCGLKETSLLNCGRPSHVGITVISGMEEMLLMSHSGITITACVEEMPLANLS
jgi:hypothetical protein